MAVEGAPDALDLGGTWRATPADETLRRSFAEPRLDDAGWAETEVPGHWRSTDAFAAHDGPLLYRRRLEAAPPAEGLRSWLVFDGMFYQGDVWLDGAYLGDTEGYFVRHTFEVTEAARARTEHVLAVEVTCAPQRDRRAKRNITGVFQHWDCFDPDWNPGGIWRGVRLEHTGPVRARSLRVVCTAASAERATVRFRAELDSDAARTIELRTAVGAATDVAERPVADGSNFVDWEVTVDQPRLWWPHRLGEPACEDVTVEVVVGGGVSHTLTRRLGLRSVGWERWTLSINGERLFLKGANQGPSRMALAEATPEELRRDVHLAKEAGLDLLRLHAHIGRPETYEAADEAGMLLWQDFPLQWGYGRGIRRQAARQAAAAVDLLGHHPSIAIWCGHNEPLALDLEPGLDGDGIPPRLAARFVAGQQLPSWNKSVLDRSVKRALEAADGSRPVIPHSGVLPHAGSAGTDSHLYFGWYHCDERDLPRLTRAVPSMARFVTEFGAQAVPTTADFLDADAWPDLDWERLGHAHALQKAIFDRRVPPGEHDTFASWQAATQAYQATVLKHHVEHLRRLKYRPTGGFCQFSFADGHPGVTWSVLDHERVPKAGHAALVDACRPVIVVADRLPATLRPGETLALDVHVVSDLRTALVGASVSAELAWAGGTTGWRWEGDVGADAVERVGRIDAVVPDSPGPIRLALRLAAGDTTAANDYATRIVTT
jgi:beta-mannosidase